MCTARLLRRSKMLSRCVATAALFAALALPAPGAQAQSRIKALIERLRGDTMPDGIVTKTWAHPRSVRDFACQWRAEVAAAKSEWHKGFFVVPGVRPADGKVGDQKRGVLLSSASTRRCRRWASSRSPAPKAP